MLGQIEKFMDKILPDLSKGSHKREEVTQGAVKKSEDAQDHARKQVMDAYRKAGMAVAVQSSGKRMED